MSKNVQGMYRTALKFYLKKSWLWNKPFIDISHIQNLEKGK